jgi:hypothetical protein
MKRIFALCMSVALTTATPIVAQDQVFGTDNNEWANDGECDDRRFAGPGMALDLDIANIGKDGTDCRDLFSAGSLTLWDATAATQATQCKAIDFGDDSGEYPNDGECDDPRFEGIGAASQIGTDNLMKDASDCSALCGYGAVALRDY